MKRSSKYTDAFSVPDDAHRLECIVDTNMNHIRCTVFSRRPSLLRDALIKGREIPPERMTGNIFVKSFKNFKDGKITIKCEYPTNPDIEYTDKSINSRMNTERSFILPQICIKPDNESPMYCNLEIFSSDAVDRQANSIFEYLIEALGMYENAYPGSIGTLTSQGLSIEVVPFEGEMSGFRGLSMCHDLKNPKIRLNAENFDLDTVIHEIAHCKEQLISAEKSRKDMKGKWISEPTEKEIRRMRKRLPKSIIERIGAIPVGAEERAVKHEFRAEKKMRAAKRPTREELSHTLKRYL